MIIKKEKKRAVVIIGGEDGLNSHMHRSQLVRGLSKNFRNHLTTNPYYREVMQYLQTIEVISKPSLLYQNSIMKFY